MELILWRHADAEDASAICTDSERALTEQGVRQAASMAKWLRARLPEGATVLASPAKRAQQTARALTADFRTVNEIGTSSAPEAVLLACGWPGTAGTVVAVGHQPTLGEVAALLMTGTKGQWGLAKGAIIWLVARERGAIPRMHLRAAISPELL